MRTRSENDDFHQGNLKSCRQSFSYQFGHDGQGFRVKGGWLNKSFDLLKTNKNIILRADRGMGKTPFMAEFACRHAKEFGFVYLDLYGIPTRAQLLQMMMKELVDTCRSPD